MNLTLIFLHRAFCGRGENTGLVFRMPSLDLVLAVYYLYLFWEVTSLLSDSVSSSVKQYTHLPLRDVPVYQVWPQLVFLPWRKFELFHPRSLKCFSLLWLWSCACEAGGLGGCPLLENFEQNSGGGEHTRSAFIRILRTQYSNILSCILNTGQWDLGLKWWYMNT